MTLDEAFYNGQAVTTTVCRGNETANLLQKRPTTLYLNCDEKSEFPQALTTPDLETLMFSLPELNRFCLTDEEVLGLVGTPTPSLPATKPVADEQELFFDALSILHNVHSNGTSRMEVGQSTSNCSSSSEHQSEYSVSTPSGDFPNVIPEHLKRAIEGEPRTVPSVASLLPLMSPINMELQEKLKLKRRRDRNRVAVAKCRQKRLGNIAKLEDKVKGQRNENSDLEQTRIRLLEQICHLKQIVGEHICNGCEFTNSIL